MQAVSSSPPSLFFFRPPPSSSSSSNRHHQGLFDAFFSFISRGVFTAVDVNQDGRIEDTEVEVAILKVRRR